MQSTASKLSMLRLGSAALPIGAFAYSQGLETAVAEGWIHDVRSTAEWLAGVLRHSILTCDVPLLVRLHAAWAAEDLDRVSHWSARWRAMRTTRELRDEDRQLGAALARLLLRQGCESSDSPAVRSQPTLGCTISLTAVRWGLDAESLAATYCFSWSEAQVGAAVRLVPLGQTQAQAVIAELLGVVDHALGDALALDDDAITSTVPGQALCSALHESLYTRLFKS